MQLLLGLVSLQLSMLWGALGTPEAPQAEGQMFRH